MQVYKFLCTKCLQSPIHPARAQTNENCRANQKFFLYSPSSEGVTKFSPFLETVASRELIGYRHSNVGYTSLHHAN